MLDKVTIHNLLLLPVGIDLDFDGSCLGIITTAGQWCITIHSKPSCFHMCTITIGLSCNHKFIGFHHRLVHCCNSISLGWFGLAGRSNCSVNHLNFANIPDHPMSHLRL